MEEQDVIFIPGNPVWHVEITSNAIVKKTFVISAKDTSKARAIEIAKSGTRLDIKHDDYDQWEIQGLWQSGIIDVKKTEQNPIINGVELHKNQLRLPIQ